MNSWMLIAGLKAPVVFNHFSTLDATLCGILFGGKEVEDITLDCIEYHDGIPMASLPVLNSYTPMNYAMRPNIERHLMGSRLLAERTDRHSNTMCKGGDFSGNEVYDVGTTGRYFESPRITYYFRGDGPRVREILKLAGAVGGQTSKGYGTLAEGIELVRIDEPMFGIFAEKKLVRPVPVSFAKKHNVDKRQWVGRMGRYAAPYRPQEAQARGAQVEHIAYPRQWAI